MRVKFIVFCFLLLSVIFSYKHVLAASPPVVDVKRLTFGFFREDWPVIHEDTILWVDPRDGGTVYAYDIKEQKEFPFFPAGLPLKNLYGLVGYDGRHIVYISLSDTNSYDARIYDVLKGEDIAITDEPGSQGASDFDKDTVVYIDGGACGKLFAYNLKKGNKKLISETACGQAKISKDVIIWIYGSNIYGYDLKKDEVFLITDNGGHPDIYKDNVVWLSIEEGFTKVHLKNLNNGESKTLHQTEEYGITYPAISDRYVIWGKTTSQHIAGVEGIDLITGEVFEIQEQGPHQNGVIAPQLEGNIAAWMAWRTGNGDIYAATISKH